VELERVDSFIGGYDTPPSSGQYADKIDPRTNLPIKRVALAEAPDVDQAIAGAARAQRAWSELRPAKRGIILTNVGRAIREHEERLGDIESRETGKPGREMAGLIDFVAEFFEYFGGACNVVDGEILDQGPNYHVYTQRHPFGVIGVILPWNAPLHQAARAIAPALAAGNAVVAKPSEQTPGSLVELARIAIEAGLPPGLLNVIVGRGRTVGPAMAANPSIGKISLTGSLRAGQELGRIAADRVLPLTLELGGKSADIVFDDADLDAAARGTTSAFTWNSGQWCAAGTRILVQRSIHDEFVKKLVAEVAKLRIGPEYDATSGPITTRDQFEKIKEYLEIARQAGLTAAIGGGVATGKNLGDGLYIEPTVYTGVTNDMRIAREEIFGPVVCVIPFDNDDDAVKLANDSDFGLSAGIWSTSASRIHRAARKLEAGRIVVNEYGGGFVQTPCGGFKMSGYGREHGLEALAHYSQTKSIIMRL
jgi:aldehyde dehydrogenase (NAD+)